MQTLNLFYEQPPKTDRHLPFDRYLQRLRRILKRGTAPAGQMRMFLNLKKGLDQIGIPYRVNVRHSLPTPSGQLVQVQFQTYPYET